MRTKLTNLILAASLVLQGFAPLAARAATLTYAQDAPLVVGGITLVAKAGSAYEALTIDGGTLTVTVPAGEAFELRYPEPAGALENDAGLPPCNVLTSRQNQLIINASSLGARTVAVTPSTTICSTANASSDDTPFISMSVPSAGTQLAMGQNVQLFWSTSGRQVPLVRIRLSTDGGASFDVPVTDGAASNNGFLNWTVPEVVTTAQARLKIEGIDGGNAVAISVGDAFSIEGLDPPPEPQIIVEPYVYDPMEETFDAATIGIDKGLAAAPQSQLICHPDSRIKAAGMDTVYYCGVDGKRYVFPNQKTHDTWYGSFAGIIELDLATIQQIPLAGNVTYRPGVRLVKVQSSPEVFAVGADGTLRYVSEAAAVRLYGPDWNTKIDDIPDAFWGDYVVGEAILE